MNIQHFINVWFILSSNKKENTNAFDISFLKTYLKQDEIPDFITNVYLVLLSLNNFT